MRAFKNHVKRHTYFNDYGIFQEIHIPLLVFQVNALRWISRNFEVSRVDFLVLSAAFTIQKNSFVSEFNSHQINTTITGISPNIIYKCLNRLLRKGIISLREERTQHRWFTITQRGMACIQSYVQSYNAIISGYKWSVQPECLR